MSTSTEMRPTDRSATEDVAPRPSREESDASRFQVLHADDPLEARLWKEAWKRAGEGDIFAHPEYVQAVADPGERPACAVMSLPRGTEIYYPFIIRPITHDAAGVPLDDELRDICTPLLYGGPMGKGASDTEVDDFWRALRTWAQEHRIVSEIIRFTPVARHRIAYPGTLREQAPHIVVDLDGLTEDEVIARFRKSTRRRYRKAIEAGLEIRTVEDESGIDDFLHIHSDTMVRAGAHERFHLDAGFLQMFHRAVPDQITYVFACQDGTPLSAEMMVFRDETSYAYLGGTLTEALSGNATTLAAAGALLIARERGSREHVLTGGVTNTVDDSLLHFKRGFTRDGDRQYFTGEQVFLAETYEQLSAPAAARDAPNSFFPLYRAGVPRAVQCRAAELFTGGCAEVQR